MSYNPDEQSKGEDPPSYDIQNCDVKPEEYFAAIVAEHQQLREDLMEVQEKAEVLVKEKWIPRDFLVENLPIVDNKSRAVKVVVLGDSNAGKSTFINALLKRKISPVENRPTTATDIVYQHCQDNDAIQYFKMKGVEENKIDCEEFTRLSQLKYSPEAGYTLKVRGQLCTDKVGHCVLDALKNIDIVDSRGGNDRFGYNSTTGVKNADIVVAITTPDAVASGTFRELCEKVIKIRESSSLCIVVNKVDSHEEDELEEAEDEMKNICQRLNFPGPVHWISAKEALNGSEEWQEKFDHTVVEIVNFVHTAVASRCKSFFQELDRCRSTVEYWWDLRDTDSIPMKFIRGILNTVLFGTHGCSSAHEVSKKYESADSIRNWARAGSFGRGFLLGLGGLSTMVVTVPASIVAVFCSSAQAAFAIADKLGHGGTNGCGLFHPIVCTAVIGCLMSPNEEELKQQKKQYFEQLDLKVLESKNYGGYTFAKGIAVKVFNGHILITLVKETAEALANRLALESAKNLAKASAEAVATAVAQKVANNVFKSQFTRNLNKNLASGMSASAARAAATKSAKASSLRTFQKYFQKEMATRVGSEVVSNGTAGSVSAFTKALPFVGGAVSGALDMSTVSGCATAAKKLFTKGHEPAPGQYVQHN